MALFASNASFFARSRHAVTTRQNLHGTIELLATDIRQASAADFLAAEPESLALRYDVSRAMVCDSTTVDRIALVVFDTVRAPNIPSGFRGTAISEPYDSAFTFLDGWVGSLTAKGAGPRSVCVARGVAATAPPSRHRELAGWRSRYGGLPGRGAIVRTYGRLSFRLSPSSFEVGMAVRRNGQEVAAPFDAASGFTYIMADGTELSSVDASRVRDIVAVRVRLMASARPGRAGLGPGLTRPVEHLIFLRN